MSSKFRRFRASTLVVTLSTLLIVQAVPVSRGRAQSTGGSSTGGGSAPSSSGDSFNFSEHSQHLAHAQAETTSANAMKTRKAPVSAMGAYTDSIAIEVPPGRSGMTPSLALTYTSGAFRSESPVGTGWQFGVPSISRHTEGGFPDVVRTHQDARYDVTGRYTGPHGLLVRDTFGESGWPSVSDALGFVPQRETEAVRYEFVAAQDKWIVHLPNGMKQFYGSAGTRNGRVVNELGAHEWLLLEEVDTDGNSIEYGYHGLGETTYGQVRSDRRRPQSAPVLHTVRWGGNQRAGLAHLFEVRTTTRPYDGPINMMAGHVVLDRLIERIEVFSEGNLAWSYDLFIDPSGDTGRPLLRSVTSNAAGTAPQVFRLDYSTNGGTLSFGVPEPLVIGERFYNDWNEQTPPGGPREFISLAQSRAGYRFEDFNADGAVDAIYHPAGLTAGAARFFGDRSWAGPDLRTRMGRYPAGFATDLLIHDLSDLDGDRDLDALSWPMTVTVGTRTFTTYHDYDIELWKPPSWPAHGHSDGRLPVERPNIPRCRPNDITCVSEELGLSGAEISGLLGNRLPVAKANPEGTELLAELARDTTGVVWSGLAEEVLRAGNPALAADLASPRIREFARSDVLPMLLTDSYFEFYRAAARTTERALWDLRAADFLSRSIDVALRDVMTSAPAGGRERFSPIMDPSRREAIRKAVAELIATGGLRPQAETDEAQRKRDEWRKCVQKLACDTYCSNPQWLLTCEESLANPGLTIHYRPPVRGTCPMPDVDESTPLVAFGPASATGHEPDGLSDFDGLSPHDLMRLPDGLTAADGLSLPDGVGLPDGPPEPKPYGVFQVPACARLHTYCQTNSCPNTTPPEPNVGALKILVARNGYRHGGEELWRYLPGWPNGVQLGVGFQTSLVGRTVIPEGGRSFYAPTTDINGDGRADIVLLKHVAHLADPGRPDRTYPVTQYVPRVYINKGTDLDFVPDWDASALGKAAVDIDGEPDSRASDVGFTKSLLDVLSSGQPRSCTELRVEDCPAGTDIYLPAVSFNSLVLDVNQDGLPDLVAAAHPRNNPADGGRKQCVPGHQVYLNRGYRFTTAAERASKLVPPEGWSAPEWTALALGEDIPLARMRNTAEPCPPGRARDQNYADVPQAEAAWTDINADGRVDLIFAGFRRTELGRGYTEMVRAIYLNGARGFERASDGYERGFPAGTYFAETVLGSGRVQRGDLSRMVDVDNDGLVDIVSAGVCTQDLRSKNCGFPTVRRNTGVVPDLLTRSRTPTGGFSEVEYLAATGAGATSAGVVTNKGTPPIGLRVVSEVRSGRGRTRGLWPAKASENVERVQLRYENFVHEENASAALGFERVSTTFWSSDDCTWSSESSYRCTYEPAFESVVSYDVRSEVQGSPVPYALKGYPRRMHVRDLGPGGAEQNTTHNFALSAIGTGGVRIREQSQVTATQQSGLWLYTATENLDRDGYGYPLTVASGRGNEGGQVVDGPERTVTKRTYAHRIREWQLGLIDTEVVEGERVDVTTGERSWAVLSRAVTAYRPDGHVATQWGLQDSGSECSDGKEQWSRTDYETYNTAGLVERLVENGTAVELRYDGAAIYPVRRWTDVPASESSPGAHLEGASTYDLRWGLVTSTMDMNGRKTSHTYDSRGRSLSVTGPEGLTLSTNRYHDPDGGPWTVESDTYTTPTSFFTTWTMHDGAGAVIATNKQVAGTTAIRVARNQYDGFGRVIASYQSATLDPQAYYHLTSAEVETTVLATRTAYDGFDRVVSTTLPDKRLVSHAYDHVVLNGTVHGYAATTNPRKLQTGHFFDSRGALVALQRLDSEGQVQLQYDYSYDGLARLVSVQDALGVRRGGFDEGGRLRNATLAHLPGHAPRMHAYCYDERDKLVSATTPAGRVVTVKRDTLGRAERVDADFPGGSGQTTSSTFYYDCSAAEGSLGKRCEIVDDASRTHVTYDPYGRPNHYEYTFDEAVAETLPEGIWNRYITELRYGLGGQLDSFRVEGLGSEQRTVQYTHDSLARTTGISVSDGAGTRALVNGATYDAFERLRSASLGNGSITEWVFDLASGHLTSQAAKLGTSVFAEQRYPLANYDPNGNIQREERYHLGYLVSEKTHTYDALDQLVTSRVHMDGVERKNERFAVTQGNMTSVAGTGGDLNYGYDDPQNTQAVTDVAGPASTRFIEYDEDGWVTHDVDVGPETSERSLWFDAGGCMRESRATTSVQGASDETTVTRNLCGAGGTRTYRETTRPDGRFERVYYLPDGNELRPDDDLFVMQLPVAKATLATLAWSLRDGSIVHEESGYIHSDLRRSVVARTLLDAADVRMPEREAEYEAWGQTLTYDGVATPRYQFVNEEPDPGTGYYYFGARAYDPTLRRWLSPDPMMLGAVEGAAITGENLNLYSYSANNPVRFIDQSGHVPIDTIWDAANVVWDAGKIVVGAATGDAAMVSSGAKDLLLDGGAMLVPYVPAGLNKIDDVAKLLSKSDGAIDAAKASDRAVDAAKAGAGAGDAAKASNAERTVTEASKAREGASSMAVPSGNGRAGSQERLRQIANDPATSSADRGWINQEKNSIDRGQRSTIRNPPGKDLAHARGREASKGYSHKESPSKLQERSLHKTQHKFDDFGRANKERK